MVDGSIDIGLCKVNNAKHMLSDPIEPIGWFFWPLDWISNHLFCVICDCKIHASNKCILNISSILCVDRSNQRK